MYVLVQNCCWLLLLAVYLFIFFLFVWLCLCFACKFLSGTVYDEIRIKSSSVFVSEKFSNLCVKILYECLKAFDVSIKYIKIQKRRAKRKKNIRELESAKQEILQRIQTERTKLQQTKLSRHETNNNNNSEKERKKLIGKIHTISVCLCAHAFVKRKGNRQQQQQQQQQ